MSGRPNVRIAPIDNWGTLEVETAATGANYTALADNPANHVRLTNNSGTTIDVRRAGTTEDPYELLNGESQDFPVVGNTKEIEVRRSDASATQVTVSAIYWK